MTNKEGERTIVNSCTRCMGTLFLSADVYSHWLHAVFVSAQHHCLNSLLHGLTGDSWPLVGFSRWLHMEDLASCGNSTIPNSDSTSKKRALTHSAEVPSSECATLSDILEQTTLLPRVTSGTSHYKSKNTTDRQQLESGSTVFTCAGSGIINSALSPGLWSMQSAQEPVNASKFETPRKVQRHDTTQIPTATPRNFKETSSILNLDNAEPSPERSNGSQSAHAATLAEGSSSANQNRYKPRRRKAQTNVDQEEKESPLIGVVGSEHSDLSNDSFSVGQKNTLSMCLAAEARDETDSWSTNDDEVSNFLSPQTPRCLTPFRSSALCSPTVYSSERATGQAKLVGNNSVTQTLWEAFERELATIEWKDNSESTAMFGSHCPSKDFQTTGLPKPDKSITGRQQSSMLKQVGVRNVSYPSIQLPLSRNRLTRKTSPVSNVRQLKTSSFLEERSDITYSVSTNDKVREAGVGPGNTMNEVIDTPETDVQDPCPDSSEKNLNVNVVAGSSKHKQTRTNKEKEYEDDHHDFSLMSSREQQINPEEIHMVESLSKIEEIHEGTKSSSYAQSTSTFSISEQSVLAVRVSKPTMCTRPLFCPRRNRQNVVTNSRDNIIDVGANVSLLSACSQKLYSKVEAKPPHKWVVYPEKVSQHVVSVTDIAQKSPRNVCNKVVGATVSSDVLRKTSPIQDERLFEEKKPIAHHCEQREQEKIFNSPIALSSTPRKPETKQEKHLHVQMEEMVVDPRSKKRKRGVTGRQAGTPHASKQLSTSISQEWANIKKQFKSIYHSTNVEKANLQKKKTEAPVRASSPAESQFGPPTALENILLNKNPLRSTILLCKSGFVTTYEEYQRVTDQGPGLVRSSRKGPRSKSTPSLMRFLEQIEKDEAVTKDSKEDSCSTDTEKRTKTGRGALREVNAERHATGVKRSEREMSAFPEKRDACKKQVSPPALVHPPLILQDRKQLERSDKNDTRKSNSVSYPCISRTKETRKINKVKHSGQQNVKKQSMLDKKSNTEGYGDSLLEREMNRKHQKSQPIHTSESQPRHGNTKRVTSKIPIPKKEKWVVTKNQLNAAVSSQPGTLAGKKKIPTNDSSYLLDVFLNLNHSPKSTSMSQCSLPHVGSNTIFEPPAPRPRSKNTALILPHLSLSPPVNKLTQTKCLTSTVSKVSSAPVAASPASSASPKKRERVSGVEVKRALRRTREKHASAPTEKQPATDKTSGKTASALKSESRLNRAQGDGYEVPQSTKGRGENAQQREGRMRKTVEQEKEIEYPDPKSRASPEDSVQTAGVPVLVQGAENTKQETDCDKKQTRKEMAIADTVDTLPEADFTTKIENQVPESKVKRATEIKRNNSQVMFNSTQRQKTSPVKAKSLPSISKQSKIKQSKLAREDKILPLPQELEENQTDTTQEKPDSDGKVLLAPIIPNSRSQLACALNSNETVRPASTTLLDDPRNVISGHSASSLKLNANRVSFSMDNVCQRTRGKLTWKSTLTFRKRAQRFSQTRLMSKTESGADLKNPSRSMLSRQNSSVSSFTKVQRGQSEPRIQTKKKELASSSSAWSKKKPISRMETNSSTAKSRTRKESCQVSKHATGGAKNKLHVEGGTARKKLDSGTTQSNTQLKTENPAPIRDSAIHDAASGNVTTASTRNENPRALVKHPSRQQEHLKEIQPNKKTVAPGPLLLTKPSPKKMVTTVANRAKPTLGTRKSILSGSRVPSKIAAVKPGTNRREKLLNNMNREEAASRANNYKQASLSFPEANNHDVASGTATSSSLHVPSRVDVTKDELQDLLNKVKLDSKLTTQTSNLGLSGKFSSKRKGVNSGDKMSRSWSEARLARPPRYLKKNTTHRNAAVCLLNATKAAQNQKAKSGSKELKPLVEIHEESSSKKKMVNSGQAALARDDKAEKTVNESGTESVSFSNTVVEVSEQPPTGNEESSKTDNLNTYVLTSFALPEQRTEAMATKAEDQKQLKSPPSQLQSDFSRNETDVHVGHNQALASSCSSQQNKRKASENESLPSIEEPTKTDADSGICTAENSRQKLTSSGYECRNRNRRCKPEHLDVLSLAITDSMEQSLSSDIKIINRFNGIVSSEANPGSFKQKQLSLRPGELDTKAETAVQETVPLGSNDNQPAGKFLLGGFNESSSRRLLTQDYLHAQEKNVSCGMRGAAEARNQPIKTSVDVSATFSMRKEDNCSQGDFVVNSYDTKTVNRQNDDAYNAIVEKYSSSSISNSMLHRQQQSLTDIKDTPHSEGLDEVTSPSLILSRSQCNLETGEAVLINVISGGRIRQMKTLRPVLAPSENCTTSFDVHAVRGISECKSSVSVNLKTAEPQNTPSSQKNQSVFVLGVPESPASNQSFLVEPLASEDTLVSVNMEQEARTSKLPKTVERSPEMLNLLNRNLRRNWERWEDEFYFSPARDSVDSQHCSNDFYIEQVDTGVQSPRGHDRKDKIPTPRREMDVPGKGECVLKSSPPNLTSKNALDRRRHSKPNEKAPFRTEGSVSLVGRSTKQCKRGPESEATIMNKTICQPPDKKLAIETDPDDCLSNSVQFFWNNEHDTKTEQKLTTHNLAGNDNEEVQEDAMREPRKIQKPNDPSLEKEKQHPAKEIKDYISMPKMCFERLADKEQGNKQKNKATRFQGGNLVSPVGDSSAVTNADQNHDPRIYRGKSCSPIAEERPTDVSKPNNGANTEESPEAEVFKKSKTKKQQLVDSGLKSPGVPERKREKTRSKVKTLRDLLWSPVGEELKQRLREEAMSSKTSPAKSRPDDSDTSASLSKEPRSAVSEGTTKKNIKPTKEEPFHNVGKASVGLEQMLEDKPKLSLTDKIEDLEMLLNSEINKYKASRGRSKEKTQLFGAGTSWSESYSRRSKKSDVAACDRSSRAKSRMSSTTDRQFQDVREKPQSENESIVSLKSERNSCRDNSLLVQTPQRSECRKLSNRSNKFRGLHTRLDDFIRFSESTGAHPMPVKKSEADDASSITYLTPTSEEDERLNTILKQCLPTSSKLSMSKRRRVESRSKKTVASKEEAMPAPGSTVKKQNDRTFNDSCHGYTGTKEPALRVTPTTRSNNKSFPKTPHHPKETLLTDQLDELPHARSRQVKDWSPEFKSIADAENMDISSASSSDIVLSWVGSCSNLEEEVTPDIPPQPCNKDLIKDVIRRAQARSPASRKSMSQTPWVKNNNEFSKVWEEDRDRFHRWRLGVNTKDHLSVTEEMVFEEVDDEREYYEDQSGPVGDNGERTGPVFDGFLQTYIGSDINNFLYQSSELNQDQELDGQDASVEPFNFPNYQGNLDSTRKGRAPNQKRGMHAYTPSPMSPSRSTSFSDGRDDDAGMPENQYFKNASSSLQNLMDRPRSAERRKRARHSRHCDKTVNNGSTSMKEKERNSMSQRRHTFRVDTPDRIPDLFPTDQEKGRYVQSAWEYQKIRSIPKELSPRQAEDQMSPCAQRDDDHFMRQDRKTEKDNAMTSPYSRDQFVSIRYRARGQHDLSPNSARSSDCLSSAERRDLGGSVRREEALVSENCASGRHRWHSSETLISGVSPGKRTRRKDRGANREPSEKQSCFGKPLHSAASINDGDGSSFKNKLSLHQHLSTKPTTDECAATNDNSNSSRASVNWYRPQSLSSSTSVQNGPTGGSSASGAAAAAATPLTERPTREGVSVAASLGVNQGGGGPGRLSLDTSVRVSLGSSTASRAVPHRQVFGETDRNKTAPRVGKIVQMFEQKRYQ